MRVKTQRSAEYSCQYPSIFSSENDSQDSGLRRLTANNDTTTVIFDALGSLKTVIGPSPFPLVTDYYYGANGNPERIEHYNSDDVVDGFQETWFEYDACNRVKTMINDLSCEREFFYDDNGNRNCIEDEESHCTTDPLRSAQPDLHHVAQPLSPSI